MEPYETREQIFQKYTLSSDDVRRMMELAESPLDEAIPEGLDQDELLGELIKDFDLEGDLTPAGARQMFQGVFLKNLQEEMAQAALNTMHDSESFYHFWEENREQIRQAAQRNPLIGEMLLLGFRMAISLGDAASMNCLGALYYMGEVVEQDYKKAAELYELAMDAGCYQSIINLGYIYEYGRIGTPDYQKAYEYYSLAAALAPSSEAVYKLGDMFSRGKTVECDKKKAYELYERSLELAQNEVEYAQPAIRIAQLLIDPKGPDYGIKPNPLRALSLFQRAEVGLRIDIADGQFYYQKRLQEAIEGQAVARTLLEEESSSPFPIY